MNTDGAVAQIREAARQLADGTVVGADPERLGQDRLTLPPPETRPLDNPQTAGELDIELDETGRP